VVYQTYNMSDVCMRVCANSHQFLCLVSLPLSRALSLTLSLSVCVRVCVFTCACVYLCTCVCVCERVRIITFMRAAQYI